MRKALSIAGFMASMSMLASLAAIRNNMIPLTSGIFVVICALLVMYLCARARSVFY